MRVHVRHIRAAGFCAPGLKEICDIYGIDIRKLVREGIPVDEIEHIEDANVRKVIDAALEDRE